VVVVVVVVVDAGSLLMVWLAGIVFLTVTISSLHVLLLEEVCYRVLSFRFPHSVLPTLDADSKDGFFCISSGIASGFGHFLVFFFLENMSNVCDSITTTNQLRCPGVKAGYF
jgi:hypothetical protein